MLVFAADNAKTAFFPKNLCAITVETWSCVVCVIENSVINVKKQQAQTQLNFNSSAQLHTERRAQ
jgi:hypothetical protein